MPLIKIFEVSGTPTLLAGGSATTITSSTTFVAGDAGVYRVMCLPSGGSGAVYDPGPPGGGGSGSPTYVEITLTAAENVSVTIGAGVGNSTGDGAPGNATSFGSYVSGDIVGGAGGNGSGGNGWAGGGVNGGDGGALGANGSGAGAGSGSDEGDIQGVTRSPASGLLSFLNEKFSGVTFSSGTPGDGISAAGGGAAGLLIDGAGPTGGASVGGIAGAGDGYGAGGGAVESASLTSRPSLAGVVVVEGPYSA